MIFEAFKAFVVADAARPFCPAMRVPICAIGSGNPKPASEVF